MLSKITFAPGFNKESTQFAAGPGWFDGDKVRFRKGKPESIGGWQTYPIAVTFPHGDPNGYVGNTYRGVCRSLYDWGTFDATKYLGVGTNLKFYVETGGNMGDITPLRDVTAAGAATFAADLSGFTSTITVTDTSHNAVTGDYVTFEGAATLGGNITAAVLNHEYKIDSIIDADSYRITARQSDQTEVFPTASDTGNGGAGVICHYQINTGSNFYSQSTGYGAGNYGAGPYGGAATLSFANQLRLWSQDAYGDDLLFCPRGGPIFYWVHADNPGSIDYRAHNLQDYDGSSLSTSTTGSNVNPNAPEIALQVMVSPVDRHVIAFGTNNIGDSDLDPLLVRWADQESVINWVPSSTNSAGGQLLSSGTTIVGAVKTRHEVLIFTDSSLTSMRFSGAPFVFQFAVVAENVSILSPNAAISTGDAVFFMDLEGFYVYSGSVQRLNCTVLSHVFDALDRSQAYKVFAVNNPDDSEVTWFYPAGESNSEVNCYVTYNYKEDVWTTGTFERGAWIQAPTKNYPVAATNDLNDVENQTLFNHEFGFNAAGLPMDSWIESGKVSIGDGDSFMFVKRLLPDFGWHGSYMNADMTVRVMGADFSMDAPVSLADVSVNHDTKQNHVRVRARDLTLRIESNGSGYGWTMGEFRLDMRTDGRR